MADPIREALKRLLAVIKPKYTDPDEIVAVVRAMAAAHTALAAEPPAPAEPDTDAVLTLAAIIRESAGNGLPGAARLAELILLHPNAASVFQPPAPAPAADGEREELATFLIKEAVAMDYWFERDTAKKVRRAAALLREPASAPAPEAGEAEELAQWLDSKGRGAWPCPDGFSAEAEAEEYEMFSGLTRAAALLRQLPPEGLSAEEYYHIDSGARIVREPCDGEPGGCWTVRNSRHVSPCTEFRAVADAVAALRQARRQEVGDE